MREWQADAIKGDALWLSISLASACRRYFVERRDVRIAHAGDILLRGEMYA